MKRIIFLAALFCLLAGANQVNAQLINCKMDLR